jgi:UDP-N-acetylglucosamine--N-acetylmuramyl-(pentapeptide) pyrophosphoryl-undecaprenol N-acetylglucosamine transferase
LQEDDEFVLFTVGGTKLGLELLRVADRASTLIKRETGLTPVVLTGPRINAYFTNGLKLVRFTPDALPYFAASSCVVTQAGASTLYEVSMLRFPCVVVPIENHWEQLANARKLKKYGFQILRYWALNEKMLIDAIRASQAKLRA